jgi:multidrug transporter EmrE-like cation transporter
MEFILSIVTIEAFGDWAFAKYVKENRKRPVFKAIGYMSYIALLEMFQRAIELNGLAWANAAWDGWSNLATGLVAIFVMKETPSMNEWIGLVMISIGLFFLGFNGTNGYKKE